MMTASFDRTSPRYEKVPLMTSAPVRDPLEAIVEIVLTDRLLKE
jgi:hypothetical protein